MKLIRDIRQLPREATPLEKARLTNSNIYFEVTRYWLLKRLGRGAVNPKKLSRKLLKLLKPLADFYGSHWELALWASNHHLGEDYGHKAQDFFNAVLGELLAIPYSESPSTSKRNLNKRNLEDAFRRETAALREGENPYPAEVLVHCYRLFEASLDLAASSREFKKSAWRPYLKARVKLAEDLRKGGHPILKKHAEGVGYTAGRGRGIIPLLLN